MESLKFAVSDLDPHVIIVQETKLKRKSQVNIEGYKCFPTIRGDNGGGVLIACKCGLDPVLIYEGDAESELLVVQIRLSKMVNLRIIGGYGVQECAPATLREMYRNSIEEQVVRAYLSGCMVLVAEDANAKLGADFIPGDPHTISENGRLLAKMLERQKLQIINASEKCTGGPITRKRTVNGKLERSCIDYIFSSIDLADQLLEAKIDSNQLYCLTKYTTTKGHSDVKRSDHYSLIGKFDIAVQEKKQKREEIFKLRNTDGLERFHKITSKCNQLRKCFDEHDLEKACNKWYKEMDRIFHRCFTKIKISEKPPKATLDYSIYKSLAEIKILKEQMSMANEMAIPQLRLEIERYEQRHSILQGEKVKKILDENQGKLQQDGSFSFSDAWKLKKKIFPKSCEAPYAVLDDIGNLVTEYDNILDVMKEEFQFRLRNREIVPELSDLKDLKEYLCKLRLEITKRANYSNWTMKQLKAAIAKLKTNKCRDPHGHVNEIYRNMGEDGLLSLLDMLNTIKKTLLIPSKLNVSNVSTIYKGKGSKQEVINLRGIFKLAIIRNILDRLIYFDEEPQLGPEIGQFQVGNQKRRNIRDHTLIIHAVVNEAIESKTKVDVQFTDIKQCFDSIWLQEATNDLYDSGVVSRNLNLIFEGNRKTQMCVETNYGRSTRTELCNVVMQGSVLGGMLCSNQISKLCNKMYRDGNVYMYRNKLPIPGLAMVDDIATMAICNSVDAINANVVTDTFIQHKKLEGQTGAGKCQWVHAGPGECRSKYEICGNEISQADSYKYLGDQVSNGLEILYNKRVDKAQGYSATCVAMCTEISLGIQLYAVAKLLHSSIFVNGTLTNMETWPKCSEARIAKFEKVEQNFMRKVLKAHSKTAIEALYLELGIIPLRFHLMKRRVLYLHTIMMRDDNELTKKVVLLQKDMSYCGDFYPQALESMITLGITEDQLMGTTGKLEELLKVNIDAAAYKFLIEKAQNHSKIKQECYQNCKGAAHYFDPRFSPEKANLLFKFRTRTFLVKNNFRNNFRNTNTFCPLCELHNDTQQHIFECTKIMEIHNQDINHNHEDVFSSDTETLLEVSQTLMELVKIRDNLLAK